MTSFTIHTPQSAPQDSQDALGALERNVGFVPNLAATIAGSPVAMHGFVAMQSALRRTRLSALEREVVGLTVSRENASAYSLAAHSVFAVGAGAGEDLLAALRGGAVLPEPRLEALRAFALAVLRGRGRLGEGELAAFVAAGYSPEQALEVLTQIAYTTMANLVANVAGTPVDAEFAARAQVGSPDA
jgi:alkylhydroperoxidase family enzyme